jgi:hypothetical protein
MKLVTVIDANGEAEALMYIAMLEEQGIKAFKFLPSNQQFLRSYYGGASLPFDVWEVKVAEADETKAKQILPEPEPHQIIIAETPPAAKRMSMLLLSSILLGFIYTLIQMIKFFFNQ